MPYRGTGCSNPVRRRLHFRRCCLFFARHHRLCCCWCLNNNSFPAGFANLPMKTTFKRRSEREQGAQPFFNKKEDPSEACSSPKSTENMNVRPNKSPQILVYLMNRQAMLYSQIHFHSKNKCHQRCLNIKLKDDPRTLGTTDGQKAHDAKFCCLAKRITDSSQCHIADPDYAQTIAKDGTTGELIIFLWRGVPKSIQNGGTLPKAIENFQDTQNSKAGLSSLCASTRPYSQQL